MIFFNCDLVSFHYYYSSKIWITNCWSKTSVCSPTLKVGTSNRPTAVQSSITIVPWWQSHTTCSPMNPVLIAGIWINPISSTSIYREDLLNILFFILMASLNNLPLAKIFRRENWCSWLFQEIHGKLAIY